jgi:quercetin dioxygenase-like cupin family protein
VPFQIKIDEKYVVFVQFIAALNCYLCLHAKQLIKPTITLLTLLKPNQNHFMKTQIEQIATTATGGYRHYQGGFFKVLISPEQTSGGMALIDITLPRGAEPPPHLHTREDETFYLLEGGMQFRIGNDVTNATPGQAIFAPRQVAHQFTLTTPTARFLTLITPGDFVAHFMECSLPVAEPKVVPPQGPPPVDVIRRMTVELEQKHGVLFI